MSDICTTIIVELTQNTMSIIRLFTSGTHNGLTFTNADIETIASKTLQFAESPIPFVMGHPEKNLPIFGFLPKELIKTYKEGDKLSLGFDKENADMSDQGMDVLRQYGCNKLSVRLTDGVMKHIGLVSKAAVAENNTQDFAALTGTFSAPDDFMESTPKGFIEKTIANIFKTNKNYNMEEKEKTTEGQANDFAAFHQKLDKTVDSVNTLVGIIQAQQAGKDKESIVSDFSSADFSHLSDEQRKQSADFCQQLPADQREAYKAMIKGLNVKPAVPGNGSVTASFGAVDKQEKSTEDIIRAQMSNL